MELSMPRSAAFSVEFPGLSSWRIEISKDVNLESRCKRGLDHEMQYLSSCGGPSA